LELMENLCSNLQIKRPGDGEETHTPIAVSADGTYSVEFVECLASCHTAPVCMVGERLHERVNPNSAADSVRNLQSTIGNLQLPWPPHPLEHRLVYKNIGRPGWKSDIDCYLRDGGYTANEIESLLCMLPVRLNLVPSQLAAVREFALLPEAASLAAANKRVANILKQAEAKGELIGRPERGKLQEKAERELYETIQAAVSQAAPLFERNDYTSYLKTFAILKTPVDAFFDSVMVMVDDGELRRNRLALLSDLRLAMNRVADLSKLAA